MENIKLSRAQENKFTMFTDVENVLDSNSTVISGIPELVQSVSSFKTVVTGIRGKAVRKGTVSEGKAREKSMKRVVLEAVILELSSALYAYGAKKGSEVIKTLAGITSSSLDRLRDSEVPNKGDALLITIEENKNELTAYGISDADIDRLRNAIANYRTTSTDKSVSSTEKTVITETLGELFKNGMNILENEIDKMVNSLKTKDPEFYKSY